MLRVKFSRQLATSPGSLIHVGERKVEKTRIRMIQYDSDRLEEKEFDTISDCIAARDPTQMCWVNIDGLQDTSIIGELGEAFSLHPLTLEDIVDTSQRPKVEEFDNYLFIVLRMLLWEQGIKDEQVGLILGKGYVLSFQESAGDVFDPVRVRIRQGKGRVRKKGADYLAYALIDAIVDNYFVVLENLGEEIEKLSDDMVENPEPRFIELIHDLRTRMLGVRRSVWPLREALSKLERLESQFIEPGTGVFVRDVYDHTVHVIDVVETFREMSSGLIDLYLSSASNKMNEVMKVLTAMASIFIPLTLIAGVYGMNFQYMPELQWRWGYFAVLFLMGAIGLAMLIYFRRKGWL